MTEQEILEAITDEGPLWYPDEKPYVARRERVLNPLKFAAFLSKHLPKEE